MRRAVNILVLLAVPVVAVATQQVPDILHYDDIEISLRTSWGYPSPLETYYDQNCFELPFEPYWTANYRGHIAVWNIRDGEFHLSEIIIDDYVCDPNGECEEVFEFYKPHEYGVASVARPASEDGEVWADWFSGVLDCYVRTEDGYCSYFFHVRDGNVVDTQVITELDYAILRNPAPGWTWSEEQKRQRHMLVLNENYITYYYRLSEDDDIEYEGQSSRLQTGYARLSPIFGFYDNQHLNWPYNWENTKKSGAPHCHWRMEDDRLYLTRAELYSGLSVYSIDKEELDLATLFEDRVVDDVVDANWVNGVYLIKHGDVTEEDAGWPGYTFTVFNVTGYTFVRLEQGRLTESYTVPEDLDYWDLPEDAEPGLIQITEDYWLPSVFDTPSTTAEQEADQAQDVLSPEADPEKTTDALSSPIQRRSG